MNVYSAMRSPGLRLLGGCGCREKGLGQAISGATPNWPIWVAATATVFAVAGALIEFREGKPVRVRRRRA